MWPDRERFVQVISSYGGRDKAMRTTYYALMFISSKSNKELGQKIFVMAKQFSAARLIGRQLNDLPMITATKNLWFNKAEFEEDPKSYMLQLASSVIFTLYCPVEHIAWLSELKLIKTNGRWWYYCVYMWLCGLIFNIARSARNYRRLVGTRIKLSETNKHEKKSLAHREVDELLSLFAFLSDFMNAVNFLPPGILWSQSFPQWKVGAFGFIASFLGFIRLYRNARK